MNNFSEIYVSIFTYFNKLIICIISLTFSISVLAGTLYKWVDNNGNISYQDQPPPPEYAASQEILKESPVNTSNQNDSRSANQNKLVVVYTVDNCDACELVLLRLKQLGIPNQEQSLLGREVQSRILSLSNSLSAPTIFIGDKLLVDTSEKTLISELKAAGYTIGGEQEESEGQSDLTSGSEPLDVNN